MINVGVIGFGYWGPNIVRNFESNLFSKVTMISDTETSQLNRSKIQFPTIQTTNSPFDILKNKDIALVAVVTPVETHFELGLEVLKSGKHLFIEKPFTSTAEQANRLIEEANKRGLLIAVDHTFLFTSAVNRIKSAISSGELGKLNYIDSTRINLGLIQNDVNVVWDLAPHDLSILNYLLPDENLIDVVASGAAPIKNRFEEIAFITMKYESGFIAHLHLNWLSPVKIRHFLISGSSRMLVWDDLSADEKIKIYDCGVNETKSTEDYQNRVEYRRGDTLIPKLQNQEALATQITNIIESIQGKSNLISDGKSGLKVVEQIEMINQSMSLRK